MVDTSYLGVPKDPARNLGSSFECRDSSWPRGVSWHREIALRRVTPAHKTVRSIEEQCSLACTSSPSGPAPPALRSGRPFVFDDLRTNEVCGRRVHEGGEREP